MTRLPAAEHDEPDPSRWSRREFVIAGASLLVAARAAGARTAPLTAQEVTDRIRAGVGVPWRETTVDTFKAGDPGTVVTGVAVTAMATLSVLRKAAAAGRNLIITHDPTFYAANDLPGARANDAVYLAKKAFVEEQRLVVWRFSDHWVARKPGEQTSALAQTLGWTPDSAARRDGIYAIATTTLPQVAAHVRRSLALRGGMRAVGNPTHAVRRIAVSAGTTALAAAAELLQGADLLVCGEPREWEAVEYVVDSIVSAQPKSMLAIGRVVSEEPGMRNCAAWLRTLITDVPVQFVAVGDPYWGPQR